MRRYLLTAGPTPVPERVLAATAQPMTYHRSSDFFEVLAEVHVGLRWIFQTEEPVLVLAGSGTAAMEAAITNFLSAGDRVLVIRAGRFGDRWAEMCETFGVLVTSLDYEWGCAAKVADVEAVLDRMPDICAVFSTASESSTGVAHPIREIAALCRARDTLCIVDAISALGAFDVPQDAWGIDVLVAASQKALMLPPGLAFVGVSKKAWRRSESARLPRFYLNLAKELKPQASGKGTAYTPAISLIAGLRESLRMMREEGLERIFSRHRELAEATRRACAAMNCSLFARESPSPSVTAVNVPAGVDGSVFVQRLRSELGVTISGGQEHLKGKIFRIAHMGYVGALDVLSALGACEMVLASLDHSFELGAGVRAAEQVLGANRRGADRTK